MNVRILSSVAAAGFGTLVCLVTSPLAADFYVDPERGNPANDGSADAPWRSLQGVLDRGLVESRQWSSLPYKKDAELEPRNLNGPVKAGDTIWLRTGDYGNLKIESFYNMGPVAIAAQPGQEPRFRSVLVRSSSHWVLRGLHISPEFGEGKKPADLVFINAHGWRGPVHDIVVEDCLLQSAADTATWTVRDWNERACNGIRADGTRITIRRNRLKNVGFGISVGASHAMVASNRVENFSGDGLRGLGNHSAFLHNTVKNCYDVNANHDDGFQSWSHGPKGVGTGEVVGMVLRGNTIINWEDPDQPHRGALQGIGCFDGMFVDWVVENNVIVVDHYHGITLSGARGCRIVNNTVIDPNDQRPGPSAIRIGKHKKGMPATGCTVRNNLASAIHMDEGPGMTKDHNRVVKDREAFFRDPSKCDFRLKRGCPAVDAGSRDLAPEADFAGLKRPQGAAVDLGAFEFVEESGARGDRGAAAAVNARPGPRGSQVVVLKFDDVTPNGARDGLPVSPRWQRLADFLEAENIKGGFGVIGWSLEEDNPAYFKWIKDLHASGRIEFWNHGHLNRKESHPRGEFEGSFEEQLSALRRTQVLARDKLGIVLRAFGPHWSGTNGDTGRALDEIPELTSWFYGSPKASGKFAFRRVLTLENPIFRPDVERFRALYEQHAKSEPCLALQGHPNAWDDARWEGFVRIIAFLKSKDCVFMTPSGYLEEVQATPQ